MAYLTVSEFKTETEGTQYVQTNLASDAQIISALERASDEANDYLRSAGYDLPLVAYGENFRGRVLDIAIYWLASSTLMLNTEDIRTTPAYINYKLAIEWLKGIVDGHIKPEITDSDTSNDESTVDTGVYVSGKPKRGW